MFQRNRLGPDLETVRQIWAGVDEDLNKFEIAMCCGNCRRLATWNSQDDLARNENWRPGGKDERTEQVK